MIRDFEDADAEGASDLIAEHSPWFSTAEGTRHRRNAVPPRAHLRYWVAEDAGRIVGWGECEFDWATEAEDVAGLWAIVHPDHRRRGLGSALFERAAEHLSSHGARELRCWAEAESAPFLERRGFAPGRSDRLSALDPRLVDTSRLAELPDGVTIVSLADLLDRLPEVHALYIEAAADMPADNPEGNVSLDEWLSETIGSPDLDQRAQRRRPRRRPAGRALLAQRGPRARARRPRPDRDGAGLPAPRPRAPREAGGRSALRRGGHLPRHDRERLRERRACSRSTTSSGSRRTRSRPSG